MKHTDFYALHKKLDELAAQELKAAIQAHGNEYVFIHVDEETGEVNGQDNAPIILASTDWMYEFEDFYVTRVTLEEGKYLVIYGYTKEEWFDEYELTSIAHGHLEYIIDHIPETEAIKDVTISSMKS